MTNERNLFIQHFTDNGDLDDLLNNSGNYEEQCDSDTGVTWFEPSDELDAMDRLIEGVVDTWDSISFTELLSEHYSNALQQFILDMDGNEFIRLKKELLRSESTKAIIRQVGV